MLTMRVDIVTIVIFYNRIAVATSPNKETALKHFKRADITEYFDAIVCRNVIKSGKYASDILLKASEFIGGRPSECLALEDSPNGIRSAFLTGLIPVIIPDLIEPTKEIIELLHAKLSSLNEVINLFDAKCIVYINMSIENLIINSQHLYIITNYVYLKVLSLTTDMKNHIINK